MRTRERQRLKQELQQVEEELRRYEEGWGGPPTRVNLATLSHDWVVFRNAAVARSNYLALLVRRQELLEALRR